jgi:KipI family sensor histidine kinase inhibitor
VIGVKAAGDAALLLETGPQALHTAHDGNGAALLAAALRAAALPGVIDVIPGAVTVLVTFDPGSWTAADLASQVTAIAAHDPALGEAADWHAADGGAAELETADRDAGDRGADSSGAALIDVVYDGPDLADVASLTGLTVGEVVARHEAAAYRVGWLGFAPGFAYLTGLDPLLAAVPRLASPRPSVPAGSVAIAGGLAAVYPAASPGGWRLLGRTATGLWDPGRDPPALLSPGSEVRFRAVDSLPPAAAPAPASTPLVSPGSGRLVEVLQPGPLTTIQDLGRAGLAHLGVPGSGAADPGSLRLANELVGNDAAAAGLEVTLGRLVLRFHVDALVAVTGAPVSVRVSAADSGSASDRGHPGNRDIVAGSGSVSDRGYPGNRDIPVGSAFTVPAGSIVRLGAPATGLRSYVAIDGGIVVSPVLGSRSADSLSGLGPGPLRPGDGLPVGQPRSHPKERGGSLPRTAEPGAEEPGTEPSGTELSGTELSGTAAGAVELRVIPGPRDDWFAADALGALTGASFTVGAASNRSGLRLSGPPLRRSRPDELLSEGMVTGALQVTHDGQLILLLADHPTTGGYPVIGVVASAYVGLAAQLRPGQRVRFRLA